MKEVLFKKIDVFTKTRYKGNPVAVIFEGDNFYKRNANDC